MEHEREKVKRACGILQALKLMYGAGLRLMECMRLRVKDVDFDDSLLLVRDGKGGKDRRTPLPGTLEGELGEHNVKTMEIYTHVMNKRAGGVTSPLDGL